MKSNTFVKKSKINTHSLKADNFKFLVKDYDDGQSENYEIVPVPMNFILTENEQHEGTHYLVYVLDFDEIQHKVVVEQEELDSVLAQVKVELGGAPVKMLGVVNE
jgi:predicted AlkP superfamily pyrophosphatase or phosphodiesterase